MAQLPLLEQTKPVNVASAPQRSPFRYPGGKTWLVPQVRLWLASQPNRPRRLIEPFAGGGIVSLTAVCENLVDSAVMVELDAQVASVWDTILGRECAWLVQRILEFQLTQESVHQTLSSRPRSVRGKAFQTLLKNRTYHGGILAPGSGPIRYGENGKGIRSRWYPKTLARRIEAIHKVRDRLDFVTGDGFGMLTANAEHPDVAFFIDPPYTAGGKRAGSRLYAHNKIDHLELFRIAQTLSGDFLMTYDNAEEILVLAREHAFQTRAVPMNNTHHADMTELLIGRNLNWVLR